MVKSLIASSAGWKVAARALRPRGVTVLMYHRITVPGEEFPGTDAGLFSAQMHWLRENCTPIAVDGLDTAASAADATARPPVLVTFDDGYRDYVERACPVLEALRIPSVVFLATEAIDTGRMIWTDEIAWCVNHAVCESVVTPWDGVCHRLASERDRAALIVSAKHTLKAMPNAQRFASLDTLYRALDVTPAVGVARQMLSWDEVRSVGSLTTWGAHTHGHPILSQVDDDQADAEIAVSCARIADETGRAPTTFAYPNGRAEDFTPRTQALLRRHRIRYGFSTIEGIHRAGDDLLAIRRQNTAGRALGDFALRVLGR